MTVRDLLGVLKNADTVSIGMPDASAWQIDLNNALMVESVAGYVIKGIYVTPFPAKDDKKETINYEIELDYKPVKEATA